MSDVVEIVVHGRHVEVSRRSESTYTVLERIDKFGIPLRRVDGGLQARPTPASPIAPSRSN